jgi:hypothetical protein
MSAKEHQIQNLYHERNKKIECETSIEAKIQSTHKGGVNLPRRQR